MSGHVTNIIIAGLGGQGVLKSSDILAEAVFKAGLDVKKAEVHGMSQRGGSLSSDVRYGDSVSSPMIPVGEADYLVVLAGDQVENNRYQLKENGVLITPDSIDAKALSNPRSLNVALLGLLSAHLDIDETLWKEAILNNLPEKVHEVNLNAFAIGRAVH